MRDDLSQDFLDELEAYGVTPVQVAVFKFASGYRYLSDRAFEYEPGEFAESLIDSWGELDRTASVSDTIAGSGVPVSVVSLSILNVGPNWFSSQFNNEPAEGVEVEIWQYLLGVTDKYLIDSYIIQDNISHSQSSITISVDLVSKLMYSDPYVGFLDENIKDYLGVSVGALSGVPGTPYGDNPYAKLAETIEPGATSILCDRDLLTAGFPVSGTIEIGVDTITYTGISGSTFTGVLGVEKSATTGRFVILQGHDYIFSFGSGPVESAGPVYVDGEIYSGPHSIDYTGPVVTVTFPDRLPYKDQIIEPVYSYHEDSKELDYTDLNLVLSSHWELTPSRAELISDGNHGSYPLIAELQGMNITIPSNAVDVSGVAELKFESGDCRTKFRISTLEATFNYSYTFATYRRQIYKWDLAGVNYLEIYGRNTQVGDKLISINKDTYVYRINVSWKIPEVVGETIRTFFDNPTINIGDPSIGGANPADAILSIASKNPLFSPDTDSFDTARAWFDTNDYEFSGFIPGDQRVLQTLNDMCLQCRSILIPRAGKYLLKVRQPLADIPIAQEYFSDTANDVSRNSIGVSQQRYADIVNDIDTRFDTNDLQAGYNASITISSSSSKDKFGTQKETLDFYLIVDETMADEVSNFWLNEWEEPYTIITFRGYLKAFPLEIYDVIGIRTKYSNLRYFKGHIINPSRNFGSWKRRKIDFHEITIAGYPLTLKQVAFGEAMKMNEDSVVDSLVGFGVGGFGEGGFGV